jgi:hypothetical protein
MEFQGPNDVEMAKVCNELRGIMSHPRKVCVSCMFYKWKGHPSISSRDIEQRKKRKLTETRDWVFIDSIRDTVWRMVANMAAIEKDAASLVS